MMTGTGFARSKRKKEEEKKKKEEGKTEERALAKKEREEKVAAEPRVEGPSPLEVVNGHPVVYVDAAEQIAGRLCSKVAKLILGGNGVTVVNAERALISGSREGVIGEWTERLEISSKVNPIYGPIHPRRPDTILRRMVRGMVPRRKPRGPEAMKRLRIYIGVPEQLRGAKFTKFEDAQARRPIPLYVTVRELSKNLGWSG